MEFKLHDVEWTDEKVSRFWDSFARIPHLQYFAQQAGQKVIGIAKRFIDRNSKILDYGSGKGFLIGYLLDFGAKDVSGCDFSSDSIQYVNEKYKGNQGFTGCTQVDSIPSKLASDTYQSVFFLETIEHLLDTYYEPTLKEISRVVRKGGYVIITTRNNEDLDSLKVICPDCGGMFHRVQHVRSFTISSLSDTMSQFGFKKIFCESRHLGRGQFVQWGIGMYKKLQGQEVNSPNLIYIGKKI